MKTQKTLPSVASQGTKTAETKRGYSFNKYDQIVPIGARSYQANNPVVSR